MLTLDQVRAVNDGFKSGDLNAALRPLEETVDLRPNELPRLDKAALSAFKLGLQNGEDAPTWAEAIFHPNISVRRFARKVFMGLGDEAAPLFEPLRARVERFWSQEQPLAESNKPREAALRREQIEMEQSALELLLRSNPEAFLEFYAAMVDAQPPKDDNSSVMQEWQQRNAKAWEATRDETDRLLKEEWGEEWVASDKRWKLPSRVLRELDARAREKPEVAQLWSELGDNPYEHAAVQWEPLSSLMATFGSYLGAPQPTGPTKRVAERLRPVMWQWLHAALDFKSSPEARHTNAQRLMGNRDWWGFSHWFGSERLKVELPQLLLNSKPPLLSLLNEALKSERGLYDNTVTEGDAFIARLWISMALILSREVRLPYNVKPKDWVLPDEVEADTVRKLTDGLEANGNSESLLSDLNTAAQNIEDARRAQSAPAEAAADPDPDTDPELSDEFEPAETSILNAYNVLSAAQLQEIYARNTDPAKIYETIEAEVQRVENEIVAIAEPEQRVRILVEPPALPGDPPKFIARLCYWKIWARELGDGGTQKLKESLWSQTEPQLWVRFEERLEAYRRAETDPVEPRIEQKLTERELKEWRAQTRRDKRALIQREIQDLGWLLIEIDGLPARLKAIELADRPSCRDLRDQFEQGLFNELEKYPGDYNSPFNSFDSWQTWRLGEEWDAILSKMESRLSESKRDDWQRSSLERQLATGFYRRGNFGQFEHYATRPGAFPRAVAAATVPYDDFEAWRVLIGLEDRWQNALLTEFWKAQQNDPTRKSRATQAVVEVLSTTSLEIVARALLGWIEPVPVEEMASHVELWERALESPLPTVKRRAMSILGALKDTEFNRESAAQAAGEALWSDNAGLAKDAAKFLSQLGATDAEVAPTVWELLGDATALDALAVNEAVFRALTQIKAKHKTLDLPEAAREKLESLVAVQSERFTKFQKKLA